MKEIKRKRKRFGISQTAVAKECGMTLAQVWNIENERGCPTIDKWIKPLQDKQQRYEKAVNKLIEDKLKEV